MIFYSIVTIIILFEFFILIEKPYLSNEEKNRIDYYDRYGGPRPYYGN